MRTGLAATPLWWGRVFVDGVKGGNHTAILAPGSVPDPAVSARRLGVPDTGIIDASDEEGVSLRTYSPVEELAQCIQTSLAAIVALDLPSGRSYNVRHPTSESLCVEREGSMVWARYRSLEADGTTEASKAPRWVTEQIGQADAVRAGRVRTRLLVRCDDIVALSRAVIPAESVRMLCAATNLHGLVLYGVDGEGVRVRVFTTSLAGAEDVATGGAVLAVAGRLREEGARGEIAIRQGGADKTQHGYFRVRIDDGIALGGEVLTLARGWAVNS